MKTFYDCIPCMLNTTIKLFKNNIIPEDKHKIIFKKVLSLLAEDNFDLSPPKIAQKIHKIIREESGINDPYKDVKHEYNKLCLEVYDSLESKISNDKDPFKEALKLAILGNIIDFGANHSFNLRESINTLDKMQFAIDESESLFYNIKKAEIILYIGDNAGEVVFDKLFLKKIDHPNIYFAVRGAPIINDITIEDAEFAGIGAYANIIDTGQDIPGVDPETASSTFKDIYNRADLIISKGQGNYESLNEVYGKNIYFLLMVKCELVAEQLGVKKGDIIVKKHGM